MDLTLETRDGLPEALRILLANYPRDGWTADPHFQGLVSFWLDRHQAFRKVTALMRTDAELLLDRKSDPQHFAKRLSRYGSQFVQDLHGHHNIEDNHYFPILSAKEPRISKGFDILDNDHHALDIHIDSFVKGANGVLHKLDDPVTFVTQTGRFRDDLIRFERFLNRHLMDEEDLIVPVILKHGEHSLG